MRPVLNLMVVVYLSILILAGFGTVTLARAVIKRKQVQQEVEKLAFYDSLTGLANRPLYQEKLALEVAHAQREHTTLAVLYLDLDHFKPINDELGHEAGDEVLKEVAVRLHDCLRETDTIARLGGDEFAALVPLVPLLSKMNKEDAENEISRIAQRVIDSISEPFYLLGEARQLGVSIGIAVLQESDESIEDLTRRADHAMYSAKHAGRNCFRLAKGRIDGDGDEPGGMPTVAATD